MQDCTPTGIHLYFDVMGPLSHLGADVGELYMTVWAWVTGVWTWVTMNMTDKESGQNIQFPQVDKGTSLHCYYVKMCRTGVTCIFTFLHNSSEGMFLCLPEELYILSAFFVCHVHSGWSACPSACPSGLESLNPPSLSHGAAASLLYKTKYVV